MAQCMIVYHKKSLVLVGPSGSVNDSRPPEWFAKVIAAYEQMMVR